MFVRSILIVGSVLWKWKKQIAIISGSAYGIALISDILATFFWMNSTSYSGFVVILLAIFFVVFIMCFDIKNNRATKFIGLLGGYSLWFYILDDLLMGMFNQQDSGMRLWFTNNILDYIITLILKVICISIIILLIHLLLTLYKKVYKTIKTKNELIIENAID